MLKQDYIQLQKFIFFINNLLKIVTKKFAGHKKLIKKAVRKVALLHRSTTN